MCSIPLANEKKVNTVLVGFNSIYFICNTPVDSIQTKLSIKPFFRNCRLLFSLALFFVRCFQFFSERSKKVRMAYYYQKILKFLSFQIMNERVDNFVLLEESFN